MTHRSRRRRAPARPAEPAYRAPNEDASRRVQIARVAELRQMWERYRTGAIGFSVPDAEVDDDDPVAAPDEPDPTEDNRTDDWELARRAAEHNPADGNRRRRGDPPAVRVAALGASTRELKRPASRRARGVNSVQLTSSSTPGDASPFSPVAASEWVNPPPPDAQRRRTNVDTRGTYQRRPGGRPRAYTLPAVVGSIGASRGSFEAPARHLVHAAETRRRRSRLTQTGLVRRFRRRTTRGDGTEWIQATPKSVTGVATWQA